MKILKVELQNINSLKSDFPIVIDFQNEQFNEVGLYAITGSTGAGKTTILDAITIALYHNVPRFNGTKGSLTDVVSHRANNAFSRITFENNAVIYEAFWSIRIADKYGKKYKNAKEEVSLKNLSAGTILASQKRALLLEVNKVTQLNYNQFLRSVMLAQGEFAAFLSAKGPEKGKLLEQITGEQIYKKIGQAILDKKSNEENKLKEIQSKINDNDVLTDDAKIELTQKNTTLEIAIKNTEKGIKSMKTIADWYNNFQNLIYESKKIDQDSINLDLFIEQHKTELELLELNEKAESYTELIQDINRNEKNGAEKLSQIKIIENELALLKPEIEDLDTLTKNQSNELKNVEKEFARWLPKFDIITKLDNQLKNETEAKQKLKKTLNESLQEMEVFKNRKNLLLKELDSTKSTINNDEAYIVKNEYLESVAIKISHWTRDLTTLSTHRKTLAEASEFITQKNKTLRETILQLREDTELVDKKIIEVKKNEEQLSLATKQSFDYNLADLLAQKEKSSLSKSNIEQFKDFSERTIKFKTEQGNLSNQKKLLLIDLESTKIQIEKTKSQIETKKKSVADATTILSLEKSISKYQNDRKNLVKGEPCGLCGSREHPFTKNLNTIDISKSELELNKRQKELNTLIDLSNELSKNEVKTSTTIDELIKQINSRTKELKAIKLTSNELNIDCELTNSPLINLKLKEAIEKIQLLDRKIKTAQHILNHINKLSEKIQLQNQSISTQKTVVARLAEKAKNAKEEIDIKQKSINRLDKICTDLENELTTKLSEFNYTLPSTEDTDLFIQKIDTSIINYTKIQKRLQSLRSTVDLITQKLHHNKKELETLLNDQKNCIKAIETHKDLLNTLTSERAAILPIEISVNSKRKNLQFSKNQLTKKIELSKEKLQKLLDAKTEKEALKGKNNKEQTEIVARLSSLKTVLNSRIKNSEFRSKQDIENALLGSENKLKYTKNKEHIKENKLKLKTLKEANIKAQEALNKSKNFKTSETESKSVLEDLTAKHKFLLTEKGKIIEAFRKDQEIRNRNQEVYKKIDAQTEICTIWRDLFKITGNSKDAFNVYVQRLTLKNLLDLANVHLHKLNKRYSLQIQENYKPKEELNFNLIDHHQTDQIRLVDTSSGGEKFIISLALALGLSDLASRNVKIDSLFIDEGFGTLDNNTLETVIATLETLQSQGKIIGIISHVESLKERIPTQIQVSKRSNGISTVSILN